MLLDMEEEQLSPTEPTHPTSFTEIPAKTEVKVQYKTEYIDRHHYHYDYNIVQP